MSDQTQPQYREIYDEAYANGLEIAQRAESELYTSRECHIYAKGYAQGAVVASKSAIEAIERT